MGLITEEVEIKWHPRNKKHYELKGYIFTKWEDEFKVKVKDLMDHSKIKVKVKCDNCGDEYNRVWYNYKNYAKEDGRIYCSHCTGVLYRVENCRKSRLKNGMSFEQFCKDNDRQDVLDRWDYELNKYKPNELSWGTEIKCWFKCPDGIHNSELKMINCFTRGNRGNEGSIRCNQCSSVGQMLIDNYGENALNIYWSNKNTIDPFSISYGSHMKIWLKCPDCGFEKLMQFKCFIRQGLGCSKCSDGVSFPNKLMFNVLEQLKIYFETEYSPPWIGDMRYDFYFILDNIRYIVEMDGIWHNKDNPMSGQTKNKSKHIDDYKDKLAQENGIEVIRINCDYNSNDKFEHIKNNIIDKLSKLFDLSIIDWITCKEYAYNSLVKISCDLWKNKNNSILEISSKLKLNTATIREYLKIGNKAGWCHYNAKEESIKCYDRQSNKIYCIELNQPFNSQAQAQRQLNIDSSDIGKCCNGKRKTAGGYQWMYYEDYLKLHNETNEIETVNEAIEAE